MRELLHVSSINATVTAGIITSQEFFPKKIQFMNFLKKKYKLSILTSDLNMSVENLAYSIWSTYVSALTILY